MKTRKVISAIIAGACALSAMSASVSAATATEKSVTSAGATTFKISGSVVVPTIDVSIPSSVSAVINPYGVAVSDKNGTYTAGGVTSAVYSIRNFTTTSAIAVQATATMTVPTEKVTEDGKATGETTSSFGVETDLTKITALSKEPAKATAKSFGAFVVGQTEESPVGAKGALSETEADTLTAKLAKADLSDAGFAAATATTPGVVVFSDVTVYTDKDKNKVYRDTDGKLEGKEAIENTGVIMVIPAVATGGTKSKPTTTYGLGHFAIAGAASSQTVGGGWTSKDKVTFNLVLDLQPTATA